MDEQEHSYGLWAAKLAAAAGLVDLLVSRFAVRALLTTLPVQELTRLSTFGDFARHVAAFSGVCALPLLLLEGMTKARAQAQEGQPEQSPTPLGLSAIVLASAFVVGTAALALLHVRWCSPSFVRNVALCGSLLATILGARGFVTASSALTRLQMLALALMAVVSLAAIGINLAAQESWPVPSAVVASTRFLLKTLEVVFLCLPLAFAWGASESIGRYRRAVALGSGLLTGMLSLGTMIWAYRTLGIGFALVLYGAVRVELFLNTAPLLYALLIAIGLACATTLVLMGSLARVRGVLLTLVLGAGFAPQMPHQVMLLCLASAVAALNVQWSEEAARKALIRQRRRAPPRKHTKPLQLQPQPQEQSQGQPKTQSSPSALPAAPTESGSS